MCRVFCATRFLSTIFQLQKLVNKTYRAKLSTADASYVVEGKITLVAVVQKSWFWFWTELGTPQRIEVKKVSWINVYFQSIWLSAVASGLVHCSWKTSLDPNFFRKNSLYLKLKRQSKSLSTQNEGKHLLSKTLLCVHTTWNLSWEFQWSTRAGYMYQFHIDFLTGFWNYHSLRLILWKCV